MIAVHVSEFLNDSAARDRWRDASLDVERVLRWELLHADAKQLGRIVGAVG
jgi:hypothetical protein